MGEAIVFTSGKGGVGKTTTIANIGAGLSRLDKKVIMLDTDMGLRNLDVVMGMEDQIQYNLLDLLEERCRPRQAIIKDRRYPGLSMIPAALHLFQTREYEGRLKRLIMTLGQEYDYCLIDCPAGIDDGFRFAVSAADRAIVVTTPHISAVRDAGRTIKRLDELGISRIELIINSYSIRLVRRRDMLSESDITELLSIPCIGVIPTDDKVIVSQNEGVPVLSLRARSGRAFMRAARRINSPVIIPEELAHTCPDKKECSCYEG